MFPSRYSSGLESLPVELILEIQLFALSPSLPFVSQHIHSVFEATPSIYRARYLCMKLLPPLPPTMPGMEYDPQWKGRSLASTATLNKAKSERRLNEEQLGKIYTKALRYPLCSESVFEVFHKLVLETVATLDSNLPGPGPFSGLHLAQVAQMPVFGVGATTTSSAAAGKKGKPKARVVSFDLPRRLFHNLVLPSSIRTWRDSDPPLPLLRYLASLESTPPVLPIREKSPPSEFSAASTPDAQQLQAPPVFRVDVNANSGYALTKAVHAQNLPLVRFLLAHGADPGIKDGIAVVVAIRQKNLALVKMLVEREDFDDTSTATTTTTTTTTTSASAARSTLKKAAKKSTKRRKLEDRLKPDARMLRAAVQCRAGDIVEWLCQEKGVVPDIQTLGMMM